MKNLRVLFGVLIFLALSTNYAFSAGWTGGVTVEKILVLNENQAIVKLSQFPNPNNCQVNDSGDVFLNPTTGKTWFALILSAKLANKYVDIFVNDACTEIWANTSYANIHLIMLK